MCRREEQKGRMARAEARRRSSLLMDHFPHEDSVARVPQRATCIDPILCQMDAVRDAVCRRYPRTRTVGHSSTPGVSLRRLPLLTHLQHWSVQEMEDQIDQHVILRWFCRLSRREISDDTTLIRLPTDRDAVSAGGAHRCAGPARQGGPGPHAAPGCCLRADRDPSPDRQRADCWSYGPQTCWWPRVRQARGGCCPWSSA